VSKGDVLPSERREFEQPETGVRVVQLTDAPCRNLNGYYNDEQFTADGGTYVFRSDRTGTRQLYAVDVESGAIVQLTDGDCDVGGVTVDPERRLAYFARDGRILRLCLETLREDTVAEPIPGCGPLGGGDLSSCGRYMVLSTRAEDVRIHRYPRQFWSHGSEALVVVLDVETGNSAIVYLGPTAEVPVAPDSHVYICRGDPSYVFWGSYTRKAPSGFKTAWHLRVDLDSLMPLADPQPLFDQRPYEFINHYYPAPDNHVQMPLYQYSHVDGDQVPVAFTRPGNVSRGGEYLPMMLDVDLRTGATRRWQFPGQPALHFKGNNAGTLWAGDCADPGFLWFAGRDADEFRSRDADPAECPAIPPDHSYHWDESGSWIGVFQPRGAYLEVRPLVRHRTHWKAVHPHPTFSPDDRWIAYAAGTAEQSQIFLAEAVWPKWFM